MNRGCAHQSIFLDSKDHQASLDLIGDTTGMWGIEVHAFALLRNHFHLLIHTPQGNLSRSMRHLGGTYAQSYNRRHHRDGPLFRGRFKAILIEADSYLLELVRYIRLNPVRAKLVGKPADWCG